MVSQAETIKDAIQSGWALTGTLSKTESDTMKEVVKFFDRDQVYGNEYPKAIVVRKINDEGDENIIRHPKFMEVTDIYTITVYYRITDVNPDLFSVALTNVEDMAREVQRIIRLTYNPILAAGTYFITRSFWTKSDLVDQAQPELRRTLQLELTQIKSGSTEVFRGYGGVLSFDTSESIADSKSGTDYIFTEAYEVDLEEGFDSIPYLTNDTTNGANIPQRYTGMFSGMMRCEIFVKESDFLGTTVERLSNIYKLQAAGSLRKELPTIGFAHGEVNALNDTLTVFTIVKITSIRKLSSTEQLTKYTLAGTVIKPSAWVVS